jgi:hypothetical protein
MHIPTRHKVTGKPFPRGAACCYCQCNHVPIKAKQQRTSLGAYGPLRVLAPSHPPTNSFIPPLSVCWAALLRPVRSGSSEITLAVALLWKCQAAFKIRKMPGCGQGQLRVLARSCPPAALAAPSSERNPNYVAQSDYIQNLRQRRRRRIFFRGFALSNGISRIKTRCCVGLSRNALLQFFDMGRS